MFMILTVTTALQERRYLSFCRQMVGSKSHFPMELPSKVSLETLRPRPRHAMNFAAPSGGRSFARQKLRKKTKNDEMKTEASLMNIAPHDPIENMVQGLTRESVGQSFVHLGQIEALCRIIKIDIGWNVAGADHDDLALLRASWRSRWKEILRFAAK
jgi:hypothetical protein